jgi:hypothetical protein
MWLLTPIGFFSIVKKPYDEPGPKGTVTIRARAKEDLQQLGKRYLPSMGPIEEATNADYRFRATAKQTDVGMAVAELALHIDYSNFKNEVYRQQGATREMIYSQVWTTLRQIQEGDDQL